MSDVFKHLLILKANQIWNFKPYEECEVSVMQKVYLGVGRLIDGEPDKRTQKAIDNYYFKQQNNNESE